MQAERRQTSCPGTEREELGCEQPKQQSGSPTSIFKKHKWKVLAVLVLLVVGGLVAGTVITGNNGFLLDPLFVLLGIVFVVSFGLAFS